MPKGPDGKERRRDVVGAARLDQACRAAPLRERLARAHEIADAMGPNDPDFDMKRFTDDL